MKEPLEGIFDQSPAQREGELFDILAAAAPKPLDLCYFCTPTVQGFPTSDDHTREAHNLGWCSNCLVFVELIPDVPHFHKIESKDIGGCSVTGCPCDSFRSFDEEGERRDQSA